MNRREFLALAASAATPDRPEHLLFADPTSLPKMRGGAAAMEKQIAAALTAGPWSVTYQRPTGWTSDAGPNDYFSEGPYWWPDPKNPGGPYIRRDGERNPDRFTGNRNDLGAMCQAALALGTGAALLERRECRERAALILATWFLDPKTRMNPHLEFGQAVRGHNTGRGTGIIDTVSLIYAAQGIVLLEAAGALDRGVMSGLRRWFSDYLTWMTSSAKGLDEKKATNNHATWWTAQAAAYALLVRDHAAREMAWEHYRSFLVPGQIQPDGSCPREEARTRSLSYSAMNLDGFAVICRLAEGDGVDLWRFRTAKGTGVESSFRYLLPYVLRPGEWTKPQITPHDSGGTIFPGLAGLGLRSRDLLDAYHRLPRARSAWVQFVDLVVRAG
jgi:hypothetical protein